MFKKILILPQNLFEINQLDSLSIEGVDFSIKNFPEDFENSENLDSYDIILTHYSPFEHPGRGFHADNEDRFVKLMNRALKNGTVFCFTHCYEPDNNKYLTHNILSQFGIIINKNDRVLSEMKLKSNSFQRFIDNWGASKFIFIFNNNTKRDNISVICGSENSCSALKINKEKGKLIFVPFQVFLSNETSDLITPYHDLIEALINYIATSEVILPNWAHTAYFDEEKILLNRIDNLNIELTGLVAKKEAYNKSKKLLFQREYALEDGIINFLRSNLDLLIERDETYKEDFWICSSNNEKKIIGEIKSYTGGTKDGAIYSILKHRDDYDLPESFPALLIINQYLNANSWKEKNKPILEKHFTFAAQKNVLICRVEDLLNLWYALSLKKIEKLNVIELLSQNIGWLEITKENGIIIHPKS